MSYSPFRVAYRDSRGERGPTSPAGERFWVASAQGAGTQTVTWDLKAGDWSVVVMNADASRDISTAVSVGAKATFMATAGWVSIGGGLLLAALAGVLLHRRRSVRSER
jgi:MYXO-CTERM domain-containing protein